ncbi:MAG: hypothetical protein IPN59_08690 [Holophaga sp.]|nr:hypothetical protein [Holophaga sp.]
MNDYTYPSIYFAYLFFAIMFGLAVFFFVRTFRRGEWGEHSEDAKYKMLEDDNTADTDRRLP